MSVIIFSWLSKQLFVGNKAKRQISKRVFQEKKSTPNVPRDEHFFPPDTYTYVCVSGCKKCSFFGKFGMLCFLETPVLRFALLPYYPRIATRELERGPKWVNEKLSHTQKETITMQILCKMFQVTAWSDFLQGNDFGPNKDLEFLKFYSMFFLRHY